METLVFFTIYIKFGTISDEGIPIVCDDVSKLRVKKLQTFEEHSIQDTNRVSKLKLKGNKSIRSSKSAANLKRKKKKFCFVTRSFSAVHFNWPLLQLFKILNILLLEPKILFARPVVCRFQVEPLYCLCQLICPAVDKSHGARSRYHVERYLPQTIMHRQIEHVRAQLCTLQFVPRAPVAECHGYGCYFQDGGYVEGEVIFYHDLVWGRVRIEV